MATATQPLTRLSDYILSLTYMRSSPIPFNKFPVQIIINFTKFKYLSRMDWDLSALLPSYSSYKYRINFIAYDDPQIITDIQSISLNNSITQINELPYFQDLRFKLMLNKYLQITHIKLHPSLSRLNIEELIDDTNGTESLIEIPIHTIKIISSIHDRPVPDLISNEALTQNNP